MRKGVAMIELILSIVIIGITILAAPQLINQSRTGIKIAVKQESIAASASTIEMIMTREWDQAGTDSEYYPTILISNGSAGLNQETGSVRRKGTPITSQRAFVNGAGDSYNASTDLKEDFLGDINDVDDANGKEVSLSIYGGETMDKDYSDIKIKMTTKVGYMKDEPAEGTFNSTVLTLNHPFSSLSVATTNIKGISVLLTTDNTNTDHFKKIKLKSFSSNIGSFKLNERRFK